MVGPSRALCRPHRPHLFIPWHLPIPPDPVDERGKGQRERGVRVMRRGGGVAGEEPSEREKIKRGNAPAGSRGGCPPPAAPPQSPVPRRPTHQRQPPVVPPSRPRPTPPQKRSLLPESPDSIPSWVHPARHWFRPPRVKKQQAPSWSPPRYDGTPLHRTGQNLPASHMVHQGPHYPTSPNHPPSHPPPPPLTTKCLQRHHGRSHRTATPTKNKGEGLPQIAQAHPFSVPPPASQSSKRPPARPPLHPPLW